jgi:putative ABC transport system permease protein
MQAFIRRLRQLLRWHRFDDDLAEEMAFHRAMAARDREAHGADREAARIAAHRAFGSSALAADQARDVWLPVGFRDLTSDVRFAFRLIWKERAFTAAAVLTLALAIGISTTVYTVINAMILRGLPVAHPDRIVKVNDGSPNALVQNVSYRDVEDWRAATSSFAELALFANTMLTIGDEGRSPDVMNGSFVSTNIFRVVEERPLLGRDFLPADEQPGAAAVVILGYGMWASRYGSDPSIVGRTVRMNYRPATVVGVMPPGFRFPENDEMWMPVSAMAGLQRDKREVRPFRACGRLAAGVSRSRAQAELVAVTERLAREYPATNRTFRAAILPFTGTAADPMFLSLFGAVSCVLLIACANVSNLLLARSGRRSREIAVRIALGATRWRVVRQLLIESLLLASLAGAFGFLLSLAGVKAFAYSVRGINFPYWYNERWTMDHRVFAFVCGVCLASAFLFGLVPAIQLARRDVQDAIGQDARTTGGHSHLWASGLLVAEIGFALMLLVGAGLMMRSFLAIYRADLAADAAQVLTASLRPPPAKATTPDQRLALFRRIEERLRTNPTLAAVTIASAPPYVGAPMWPIELDGRRQTADDPARRASFVTVDRDYFATLGATLLRGRPFTDDDGMGGHEAAIVNQQFVTMFLGSADPIGRRVCASNPDNRSQPPLCAPIIGVSPTVRQQFMSDLDPVVYFPLRANPVPAMVLVRSADLHTASTIVRSELQAIEPDTVVWRIMPLGTWMEQSRWGYRVFGTMFSVFAAIALVLSAVGIYAVTAYSVVERTREIGIRVALGARTGRVMALFIRRKLAALGIGLALGMSGALAVGRLIRSLLVQTSPTDATTLTSLAALLATVAMLAVAVPAFRASRIDPTVALRHE